MKIFITGNSRSGTTMMSRILGNHKDVFTFQELHFFDELLQGNAAMTIPSRETGVNLFATLCAIQRDGYFGSRNSSMYRDEATKSLNTLTPLSYSEILDKFLISETKINLKSIPCEQTPQHVFALDEILTAYNDARVIIMFRDPREVLLSQKHKWKRRQFSKGKIPLRETIRSRINYHPVTISKIWKSVMQTAQKYEKHPSVILVSYEALIHQPEETIQTVCTHCNISYSDSMLDIPITGSSQASDDSRKRGIDKTKTRQWENGGLNATEIYICQQTNAAFMQQYGYEKKEVKFNWLLMTWYILTLPFSLMLAVLFNLKRLKHIKKMARRFSKN